MRPSLRAVEPASAGFERIVQTESAKLNTREALAGVAGWKMMGKVDIQIAEINSEVTKLQAAKIIDTEKATLFYFKISELSRKTGELFTSRLKKLDTIARANEKPGEVIEPFLRDLNFHTIKSDIKTIETANNPKDKQILSELKKDLTLAEEDRKGLTPADDEVVKLALKLTGAKELPAKFKDEPLEVIENFFNNHNLNGILKNDRQVNNLAGKLGISGDQVKDLVSTYNQGKLLATEMKTLNDEIMILDPEKGKGLRRKRLVKGGATIAAILSALSAYSMFNVIKKDNGGGPQG